MVIFNSYVNVYQRVSSGPIFGYFGYAVFGYQWEDMFSEKQVNSYHTPRNTGRKKWKSMEKTDETCYVHFDLSRLSFNVFPYLKLPIPNWRFMTNAVPPQNNGC